jgi:hypothetical protein
VESAVHTSLASFDDRLESYADTFYGYGTYSAKYWFIGIEEGGGGSIPEIERRVSCWLNRGGHELEDLVEYHSAIGVTRWFDPVPKLQPTWRQLIRVLLAAKSGDDREAIRRYQASKLGRWTGQTCLIELLTVSLAIAWAVAVFTGVQSPAPQLARGVPRPLCWPEIEPYPWSYPGAPTRTRRVLWTQRVVP